ncbi:MAG: plasmid pRiA4b ORF-3 family protein [Pseudonocardiaceae bacterium]
MATAGTVAGEAPGTVYRLRVVLSGISPMIWRQLEVPATLTLAQLHEVLQASFAWSGEHLHRFTVHGRDYGSGELWLQDPSTVRLADLGLRERERFTYAYDFFSPLECWRHDLRVTAITPLRTRRRYPWCSGGARTAPQKTVADRMPSWPCAKNTACGPPPCGWPSSPRSCWKRRRRARDRPKPWEINCSGAR